MRTRVVQTTFITCLLFVAGCSSPSVTPAIPNGITAQPQWLLNPPTQAGYAFGVGSALIGFDSARAGVEAQNNALLDLIGKMQVSISGTTTIKTRRENAKLDTLFEDEIKSSIPKFKLKNAEFTARYVDTKNQYLYVLARLNRQQAAFEIASQMSSIELSLLEFESVSNQLPNLEQWRALKPALKLIAQHQQLNHTLNIVSPTNQTTMVNSSINTLETRIFWLLQRLVITLKTNDKNAQTTASTITKTLTESGFGILASDKPDLLIDLQVSSQSSFNNGTYYVFADGSATIQDSSGRVLSEYGNRAKGTSSVSKKIAQDRAYNEIGKGLGQRLVKTLLEKI